MCAFPRISQNLFGAFASVSEQTSGEKVLRNSWKRRHCARMYRPPATSIPVVNGLNVSCDMNNVWMIDQ